MQTFQSFQEMTDYLQKFNLLRQQEKPLELYERDSLALNGLASYEREDDEVQDPPLDDAT